LQSYTIKVHLATETDNIKELFADFIVRSRNMSPKNQISDHWSLSSIIFLWNYAGLTTWIGLLSDNVSIFQNFEFPNVTVINRAAKFLSLFDVNSIIN